MDVTVMEETHWNLQFNDSLRRKIQAMFSAFDTAQAFKNTNWSVNVSFLWQLFCLFSFSYKELVSSQPLSLGYQI